MRRAPPISTLTDTLFPNPTLFRSPFSGRPQSQHDNTLFRMERRGPRFWRSATYRTSARRVHSGVAAADCGKCDHLAGFKSEEHTSELQSLMRISYAVFCLKKKKIR